MVNWVRNLLSLLVDNSLSVHTDNRKKDIFVLGEGSAKVLIYTKIISEVKYSIHFYKIKKKFIESAL